MAGKSTFMRQVAISVILAQMGAFVPARRAHVGVVDRVLTRVGASDNLSKGESTFMVEMKETANILRRATPRSLVVLDEIGRGTSTYDGLSIAWAVAENLHDVVRARALFATHYHELTRFVETAAFARNHSVSARVHAGDIVFFHRVEEGAASRSYGVACAKLAGLPEGVISRAQAILDGLENREELPTGAHAGGAGRAPQLSLFAERGQPPAAAPAPAEHPALAALREADPDRMTPLDALVLVTSLRRLADG
jgi:DNA mismatch repair protein MutS